MKRKLISLLIVATGIMWLGINCFPEPDLSLNLLSGLTGA
jgi:hypothetical protein